MPSGDKQLAAAGHEQELLLADLRGLMESTTVQVLRQAARQWGWTLKGTAKTDLVEQMLGYLSDRANMAQALQTLPSEDLAVLCWLAALGTGNSSSKQIHAALAEGSGIRLSQKAIDVIVQSLVGRCLLFLSEYQGYRLPDLYRQWLPRPDAPKLLYAPIERLHQPALLTVAAITQHAQHLLSAVTAEQPPATVQPKTPPRYLAGKKEPVDPRRPSLIAAEILTRWGYVTANEQLLARFLLEQMANARLFQIIAGRKDGTVVAADQPSQVWEMATEIERLKRLRRAYLTLPKEGESRLTSWSEWDIVFV